MNRFLTPVVSLLLVPCLMADPMTVSAAALLSSPAVASGRSLKIGFASQALADPGAEAFRAGPTPTLWRDEGSVAEELQKRAAHWDLEFNDTTHVALLIGGKQVGLPIRRLGLRRNAHGFKQLGENMVILPWPVETLEELHHALVMIRSFPRFVGAVITSPWKEKVLDQSLLHLKHRSSRVSASGAANLLFKRNGDLWADSNDGVAFVDVCKREFGIPLEGRRVVILGGGGAGREIAEALLSEKNADVVIAESSDATRKRIAGLFAGRVAVVDGGSRELEQAMHRLRKGDIVVNATGIGMPGGPFENAPLPVKAEWIPSGVHAFDLLTVPLDSPFLQMARERGAIVHVEGARLMSIRTTPYQMNVWMQETFGRSFTPAVLEHLYRVLRDFSEPPPRALRTTHDEVTLGVGLGQMVYGIGRWFGRTMERPVIQKDAPFWGAGIAMVLYGLYARDALGWWGIAFAAFGIFWVLVGRPVFWGAAARWERFMDAVPDEFVTEPTQSGPKTEADRRHEWRWYWKGVLSSAAITGFSLWRAWLTAWRPVKERYYFFDHGFLHRIDHRWFGDVLRVIDHSWLNDFLTCLAAVAGSYLIFQASSYAASYFTQETGRFLDDKLSRAAAAAWPDYKRRMRIILMTAACLMLQSAWHEKVALLGAAHWDKWDILAEGSGFILSVWLLWVLLHPLFTKRPHFSPETVDVPDMRRIWPKLLLDVGTLVVVGLYLHAVAFLIAGGVQTPFTTWERWMVPVEATAVFLIYRFIIRWHVGRPSDLTLLKIGREPPQAAEPVAESGLAEPMSRVILAGPPGSIETFMPDPGRRSVLTTSHLETIDRIKELVNQAVHLVLNSGEPGEPDVPGVEPGILEFSPLDNLASALIEHQGIKPGEKILELGAWGMPVLSLCAELFGASGDGMEYKGLGYRVALAMQNLMRQHGMSSAADRIHAYKADFLKHDWSSYDVIYYYASGAGILTQLSITEKIASELKVGGRFVVLVQQKRAGSVWMNQYPDLRLLTESGEFSLRSAVEDGVRIFTRTGKSVAVGEERAA